PQAGPGESAWPPTFCAGVVGLVIANKGQVAHLDLELLHAQLLGLERRTSRGGKDSIDHAPRAHDDIANSTAAALLLAVGDRPSLEGRQAAGLAARPYKPVDWEWEMRGVGGIMRPNAIRDEFGDEGDG